MVLNVDDLQIYDNLVNEIMSNQKEYNHINFTNENNFEYVINENLKFVLKGKKILIDFSETKLPHSRLIMSEELKVIFSSFKAFELIDLSKIEKSSWFCLLWTPIKSSKLSFSSTSFLAYYQFGYTDNEVLCRGYNDYVEIPIIGLLPIKFDEKTWLKKISK